MLCPDCFIKSESGCKPFISKLLNEEYSIRLLLTPTSDKLLPRSYLKELTAEQRKEPGTWFDAHGAPLDGFSVFSKDVIINNTEYVDEMVVKIGKSKYPISLSKAIGTIQNALENSWAIELNGEIFQYDVEIYRYAEFIPTALLRQKAYVLNQLVNDGLLYEDADVDELFNIDLFTTTFSRSTPFILRKTNFCNRVQLKRSEWIAGFQEIRLNTSKDVFESEKWLGDSEFDIFLEDNGEPTVEICVEDFNPGYEDQSTRRNATVATANNGMCVAAYVLPKSGLFTCICMLTLKLLV